MNCLLRGVVSPIIRSSEFASKFPSVVPVNSFHATPPVNTIRWKRYKWTPWPWPLGIKNVKNRWLKHRPGKVRALRKEHLPGAEEGQISGPYCKKFQAVFWEEGLKVLRLFARQCEVYAAQRILRTQQMFRFYRNWYSRPMVGSLLRGFFSGNSRLPSGVFMSFIGAAVFALERDQVLISADEIASRFEELDQWAENAKKLEHIEEWDVVTKHPYCDVWQKKPVGSTPPEYRAMGTFSDVPARIFFHTQLDVEYRRKWDKLVIKLDVVDKDDENQTEVLHWVSHYPFPFHPREYVFQRRYYEDEEQKVMIIISKSCDYPTVPRKASYVRVKTYYSALIIRPHQSFDEKGFDYILMYIDDPQTYLPKMAVQYAAKSSLPDFMIKVHHAAKALLQSPSRSTLSSSLSIPTLSSPSVQKSSGLFSHGSGASSLPNISAGPTLHQSPSNVSKPNKSDSVHIPEVHVPAP